MMEPWFSAASPYPPADTFLSLPTTTPPTPTNLLSPRKMPNREAFLTSKILFSQLTSYPHMLVDGRGNLPPFIFPQCVLDGKSADACRSQAKGNHTCLPEALANCTSLLHMFFNRTAASSGFVWRSIYDYQRQLGSKTLTSDTCELVAALQVVVILILVQALDMQSIPTNDVLSLVATTRDIAQQLHVLEAYQGSSGVDEEDAAGLSRREWTARESVRRCFCALYMVELVFEVIIAGGNADLADRDCQGFTQLPLPAERGLWETVDDATWIRRYRDSVRCRADPTIGHLRQSSGVGVGDLEGAAELEYWCGTADDFGSLVWMSSLTEHS
ncbi:hypothetical protein B0T16DRAFT_406212 [Cercophora newfieldiana]|uniref:SRCR domain-containing protein n=1 Tax=Cercophora newfieldiana TaxID=92897 RepID=A0AA39YGY8_9PEZI|nr:hypothetical protein B0T16DRAFT_406212 [Cercophora newfieldiana]